MMLTDAELLERAGRRVRVGMVGGGADSVIGETHRIALRADGLHELVAGAMSIDPQIALQTARANLIAPDRSYTDYHVMAETEARREDGIDMVVVATPPQSHLEIAQAFIAHGIHVLCEKPMTRTAAEAENLVATLDASDVLFTIGHCYSGYPLVRHARDMVAAGKIGAVTIVEMEFPGGEPGVAREPEDPETRHWRFRPEAIGRAAILGELGTHVHHLAMYVSGLAVNRVSAQLHTFAARRDVYDNAFLTIWLEGAAVGRIWNSYVAIGNEHGLGFRIYGEDGGLLWRQEDPETLWHQRFGRPAERITKGMEGLSASSLAATRFRPGHPEGYALAFANMYRDFGRAVLAQMLGEDTRPYLEELPTARDGLATLRLYEAAERSHEAGGKPVALDHPV
jgi:predicted dehydrogenase